MNVDRSYIVCGFFRVSRNGIVNQQGRSQGRVPGVKGTPLSRLGTPPLLFLTVILSQQECNGLSILEILRFVLCLQ